jgi:hypothetical protein
MRPPATGREPRLDSLRGIAAMMFCLTYTERRKRAREKLARQNAI